jgi:hypothetical protein
MWDLSEAQSVVIVIAFVFMAVPLTLFELRGKLRNRH